MVSMNSLIQSINDKSIELDLLLTEFNSALLDTREVYLIDDDESGTYKYSAIVIDEEGIKELEKIYEKLEKIIGG